MREQISEQPMKTQRSETLEEVEAREAVVEGRIDALLRVEIVMKKMSDEIFKLVDDINKYDATVSDETERNKFINPMLERLAIVKRKENEFFDIYMEEVQKGMDEKLEWPKYE